MPIGKENVGTWSERRKIPLSVEMKNPLYLNAASRPKLITTESAINSLVIFLPRYFSIPSETV